MFKVGDILRCISTNGWKNETWYNGKPFKVAIWHLPLVNGKYTEDFIYAELVYTKPVEFGIVKWMRQYEKI